MGGSRRAPIACGVDIGSTNIKVIALDVEGAIVGRANRRTPRSVVSLWIDAQALFNTVEDMVIQVCGDRFEVHTVCAAGIGEDGILVDAQLQPLTKALAWFDPRRQGIFHSLRAQLHDDDVFDAESDPVRTIVGWKWSQIQAASAAARSWVALSDLAGVYWTGRLFLSETLASRTGAWRMSERAWADDRVTLTLGSADLLPPVLRTGDVIGNVNSTALRFAGAAAADAIAVAGGHDHPIGGWAIDQLVPGAVLDSMGTAEVVVAQSPLSNVVRNNFVEIAPGIRSAGTTLLRVEELSRNVDWASQDPDVAVHIHSLLDGSTAPAPVLDSGYFIPGKRGGGRPSYSLDAPRDPRARASSVLGALAHVGREAVDAVRKGVSEQVEVRLAGGWARSAGWVDIKSAVNGYHTETVPEPEVTAVGAAILAAQARGWRPDAKRALDGSGILPGNRSL